LNLPLPVTTSADRNAPAGGVHAATKGISFSAGVCLGLSAPDPATGGRSPAAQCHAPGSLAGVLPKRKRRHKQSFRLPA
jgi:hypothetical protein